MHHEAPKVTLRPLTKMFVEGVMPTRADAIPVPCSTIPIAADTPPMSNVALMFVAFGAYCVGTTQIVWSAMLPEASLVTVPPFQMP